MSPRKRNKENVGLPARWRKRSGAYYYMVPPGLEHKWNDQKEFHLGYNLADAHRTYADRIGEVNDELVLFRQLAERYLVEYTPTKSRGTRQQHQLASSRLTPAFGEMKISQITPQHAYQFFDALRKAGKSIASGRADIAVLRHMLTMAVRWGAIARNPLIGQLRLPTQKAPERYLEDWEIAEILSVTGVGRGAKVCVAYVDFKNRVGLRRSDILRMTLSAAKPDGIHCQPNKTKNSSGKRLVFEWDDVLDEAGNIVEVGELRQSWNRILAIAPRRNFPNQPLFCTRFGEPYIDDDGKCSGFDSIWRRFVSKVKAETRVTEHFTEKDIRAKVGSDLESDAAAASHLGNSEAVARKSYRRKPTVVTPIKRDTK